MARVAATNHKKRKDYLAQAFEPSPVRSSARCCKFLIWTQRPGSLGIIWNPELAVTHKHRHPEWDLQLPLPRPGVSLSSTSSPGSSPWEAQLPPLCK